MAYTAIEQMRQTNLARFGADLGPCQPPLFTNGDKENSLQAAALRFLHDRCEGLLFSEKKEELEKETGKYLGKALKPGQIPYNMQMDINRLCLEKALESFFDSGVADDAYTVYYSFIEIFLGEYSKSKRMIELLSEYESNGSSLLMKHRDHYSHSVYVFALGLAIYETNESYRSAFKKYYKLTGASESAAANFFLEYWGFTSLFHDIGYPFELPFEQVLSYFEVDNQDRGNTPFLAYRDMEKLTGLSDGEKDHFEKLFGMRFDTVLGLLAHDIYSKLGGFYGFTEEYMREKIETKPVAPETFGYYMDHGVFSAARLYSELLEVKGIDGIEPMHMDVLSAIIMHNSLFKFAINFYKSDKKRKPPLDVELHPLAWLLMYCDELQCWDRTAYGRNSRTELHPMAAEFDFSNSAVDALYLYDAEESDKINDFKVLYKAWEDGGEQGKPPRLKAYSDMAEKEQRFTADILKIINTDICPLTVTPSVRQVDRSRKHTYLSGSNFLHLYDFAVALKGRNAPPDTSTEELERQFEALSLEYQISGINRAKSFARYLNAINCFYTDKPVDFEMVTAFTPEQSEAIAPMEHERWVLEHQGMGWKYGKEYEYLPIEDETKGARSTLREQLRRHKLTMDAPTSSEEMRRHWSNLPEEDQDKDWRPFNSMLKILKKFDGLRIYKLG